MVAKPKHPPHRFSVAPMMDWTDRWCRYFHRLLSQHTLLYTEMLTPPALIHGDYQRYLAYDESEHPVALQLGGHDPKEMATAAKMGADYGYDEININVGCPSDRVQSGRFGACLMAEPNVVADCFAAMQAKVDVPVTVKTRIGIDRSESYEFLYDFIKTVATAGCKTFIVHARKAWLDGLSPKENRTVPPLRYDVVYQVKKDFPDLTIVINGGIQTLDEAKEHLKHVDGVMMGRAAYENPYILANVDAEIFDTKAKPKTRAQVLEEMFPFIEAELQNGTYLSRITKHILGLYHSQPKGKHFRRVLSENAVREGAGLEVIKQALQAVES